MLLMTRKLSITVPDDVAKILDRQENASAYVTESVRLREQREDVKAFFARHGYDVTDEGMRRMGERLAAKKRQVADRIAAGEL
jgi:hypothetical protein